MSHPIDFSGRPFERRQRPTHPAFVCALLVVASLSACSSVTGKLPSVSGLGSIVTPYKIDIQQGNVITREQAEALQPGMSRLQVRDLLGTPLLTSVFHADRWDYVFTFRRQGLEPQSRKLTVFFKNDLLERFDADELPSEDEFVASLDTKRKFKTPPPLVATEEQLRAFQERNKPTEPVEPAAVVPGVAYPPLEPSGSAQ